MSQVINVLGDESLISGRGDECPGDECQTIPSKLPPKPEVGEENRTKRDLSLKKLNPTFCKKSTATKKCPFISLFLNQTFL